MLMSLFSLALIAHPTIVNGQTTHANGRIRQQWTVQVGPSAVDRFEMYHVRKVATERPKLAVLLASPLPSGFQLYEQSLGAPDNQSFVDFLTDNDLDVWGASQRVQDLKPGTCEASASACASMANWGLDQLLDDLDFVRTSMALRSPARRVVIGGLSLGSMLGYAAVNRHPFAYDGVIAIDGAYYETDSAARAYAQTQCDTLNGMLAAGVYFGGTLAGWRAAGQLDLSAPNDPSPLVPGLTNAQAFVSFTNFAPPGPLSFQQTFVTMVGDIPAATMTYSDRDVFATTVAVNFVNYVAWKTVRDIQCSLAGAETQWYSNLGAYQGKIFMQGAGLGFGQSNLDMVNLAINADKTTAYFPSYGHVDPLYATNRATTLYAPLLAWLSDLR